MKYSYRNIDWDDYREYSKNKIDSYKLAVLNILEKNGVPVSSDFVHTFFFMPLSQQVFLEYLQEKDLTWNEKLSIKKSLKKIARYFLKTSIVFDEASFPNNEYVSMAFFHRHPHFEKIFSDGIDYDKACFRDIKISYHFSIQKIINFINGDYKRLSHDIVSRIEIILWNKNVLNTLSKVPKYILASGHYLYDIKSAFYLSVMKQYGVKVIIVQPGLLHDHVKYFEQFEYEVSIADLYLSYGKGNDACNIKPIGSMYSCRVNQNSSDDSLILLAQVPTKGKPRVISSYWSHFNDFDTGSVVSGIREITENDRDAKARCKSCDFQFYRDLFDKNNIDVELLSGDINNGEEFGRIKTAYIMYYSTSICESYYKGSNVKIYFDESNIILNESEKDNYNNLVNFSGDVGVYLGKYCTKTTPLEFK